MDKTKKVWVHLVLCTILVVSVSAPGLADVTFTDSFAQWVSCNPIPANLVMENVDFLRWNANSNFTAGDERCQWVLLMGGITGIEFDYQYKNTDFDDRLEFRLLDADDNELWNANPEANEGLGIPYVIRHVVITGLNTTALKFEYHPISNLIVGKPEYLNDDPLANWDAWVDNVTVSTVSPCAEPDPDDGGLHFINDFGAWANTNGVLAPDGSSATNAFPLHNVTDSLCETEPPPPVGIQEPNGLEAANQDWLVWNLKEESVVGPGDFLVNSYEISAPSTITGITFDWRFGGEDNNLLLFQLLDDANTVLWTAPSIAVGPGEFRPFHCGEVVDEINTKTLRFEYRQLPGTITGDPNFFNLTYQDDWDALVDNVTLTFEPAPDDATVFYYNDFSDWKPAVWNGLIIPATNDDALRWNLHQNAGTPSPEPERGMFFQFDSDHPEPNTIIKRIEFDWRFANDGLDERLELRLIDGAEPFGSDNNVLWTATSTPAGISKPLHVDQVLEPNIVSLRFEYLQKDALQGQPDFFGPSNLSDWDAFVDNIVLTLDACKIDFPGDITSDCFVGPPDLKEVFEQWLQTSSVRVFDDDFSAWFKDVGDHTVSNPSLTDNMDNSDSLKWNLVINAGVQDRTNKYTYTHTEPITSIEFDYRYKNDDTDGFMGQGAPPLRLEFRLLDDANNVLFNANDVSNEAEGVPPVVYTIVLTGLNTTVVKFDYHQVEAIRGKPAFFHSSNANDWDAEVQRVIINGDTVLSADVNSDNIVNLKDFRLLENDWMKSSDP